MFSVHEYPSGVPLPFLLDSQKFVIDVLCLQIVVASVPNCHLSFVDIISTLDKPLVLRCSFDFTREFVRPQC